MKVNTCGLTGIASSNASKRPMRYLIWKITQIRGVALAFTVLLYPGFASATTQIDSLFEQFNELATSGTQPQDLTTQEFAPQIGPTPFVDPVANAGPDQPMVASGTTVTLDGTGSAVDQRRTITSYAWRRMSTTGESVALSSTSAAQPTFTADTLAPGATDVSHVFELTVTDNAGDIDTDTVTVTIIDCALTFAEARQKIDDLSLRTNPIEQKVTDLNDRHRAILDKMPRVGAAEGACTSRLRRDIEGFRSNIDRLDLESLKQPVDNLLNCIVNFRQENVEQERQLEADKNSSIAASIKLSNRKKIVTDMDHKRNEFAVFLGQIESFLDRRLFELSVSEEINCPT